MGKATKRGLEHLQHQLKSGHVELQEILAELKGICSYVFFFL